MDPASSISFATSCPFPPSSKRAGGGLSRVEVEDRAALFLFIHGIHLCFCFIMFFLLFLMQFSMCIRECVGKPRSPGKCSHSYTSLGLGKGAQKIILCSIPKPGSAAGPLHGALKNSVSRPQSWKFGVSHSEHLEMHISKKHPRGFCWVVELGSSEPV